MNDELSKTKDEIIAEFKAPSAFSKIIDEHYTAGFEDFHQVTEEHFSGVDFSLIVIHVASENSVPVNGSNEVNVEDEAATIDDVVL